MDWWKKLGKRTLLDQSPVARTHWRARGERAARLHVARQRRAVRGWLTLTAIFGSGFLVTLAWLNRDMPQVRQPVERFALMVGALSPYEKTPAIHVYYPRCAAAHAEGVYSIRRGQPGYRPPLDADGDGLACEPVGAEMTDMIVW